MLKYTCCSGDFDDPGFCSCGKKLQLVVDETTLSTILASNQPIDILNNLSNLLEISIYRNWCYEYRKMYVEFLHELKLALPVEYHSKIENSIAEAMQRMKENLPVYRIDFDISKQDQNALEQYLNSLIVEIEQLNLFKKGDFLVKQKKISTLTGINAILNVYNLSNTKIGGRSL